MRGTACVYPFLMVLHLTGGEQLPGGGSDRRLINRRPVAAGGVSAACGEDYDPYSAPESRTVLAALGGAAVGGVLGGAVGYHIGTKHQKPVVVNNNVYNHLPSPCYSIPVQVTGGPGSGGGGIIGGLLSHHPILSSILQGGVLSGIGGGGGGGGYGPGFQTNRNIRQFQRRVVRPLTRIFK